MANRKRSPTKWRRAANARRRAGQAARQAKIESVKQAGKLDRNWAYAQVTKPHAVALQRLAFAFWEMGNDDADGFEYANYLLRANELQAITRATL